MHEERLLQRKALVQSTQSMDKPAGESQRIPKYVEQSRKTLNKTKNSHNGRRRTKKNQPRTSILLVVPKNSTKEKKSRYNQIRGIDPTPETQRRTGSTHHRRHKEEVEIER